MSVRLMVVDDHRLLAEALASALKLRGHRVLAAAAPSAGRGGPGAEPGT